MENLTYLGHGCLYAEISEKAITFVNSSIVASKEVGCVDYEMFSNPYGLEVKVSKKITAPHNGGGDETTNTVIVELRAKTSFLMMCNSQNQVNSYIRFNVDELGEISFTVIAEECYYEGKFQGRIGVEMCTEEELQNFLEARNVSALQDMPQAYATGKDVSSILYTKSIEAKDESIKEEAEELLASAIKYSEFYMVVSENTAKAAVILKEIAEKFGDSDTEYIRAASYLEIF
tara:strand:+ start:1992 stop:2687 length:696 start_codon:yes stop_codon:yes gene_type:complete